MAILIDTSVAIELRDGHHDTRERLLACGEKPAISSMTVIELEGGVYARPKLMAARRIGVNRLLGTVPVVGLDAMVIQRYRQILGSAGFSRRRILDRLIAATAMAHDLTLITINGADFRDIPGLKLEIWPAPAQ